MKIIFGVLIYNLFNNIFVHSENHSRLISTTGLHKTGENLFFTVASNNCGYLVWNGINVHIPVQRISMCNLNFCKICRCLIYTIWNATHSKSWYHYPVVLVNRHLLALFEPTQHTYSKHSFVFYIMFCPIVSLKIM